MQRGNGGYHSGEGGDEKLVCVEARSTSVSDFLSPKSQPPN
jgi:hypothetical protein